MDAPRVSLDCATGIVTLNKGQNLRAPSWYVNEIRPMLILKRRATFKQNGKAIYFN